MVPARDHCGDRGGGRFAGAVLSSAFRVGGVVGGGGLGDLGGGGLGDLGEAQGAGQERGHLGPGHRLVGAVAQGVGLAAGGDAGPGQGVDVGFVEAACGVGEPGRVGGCRQVEGAGQERGHLGPVHRPVRAEPQRVDQAARGDLQPGQTLDVGQVPLLEVHVGEARRGDGGGFLLVDDPHQPHRHRPALHLAAGAEHVLGALRAVEHAPLGQRINSRLVYTPSDIAEPARRAPAVLLSSRPRRQPDYRQRSHEGRNHDTDHGTTLPTPMHLVQPYRAMGHHDLLHTSKTMDIVCAAFASRGSGSPNSVLRGTEAPARWKPTLLF